MDQEPKPPRATLHVKGRQWTIEAQTIVALMRRLGVTELELKPEEMTAAEGLVIYPTASGGVKLTSSQAPPAG